MKVNNMSSVFNGKVAASKAEEVVEEVVEETQQMDVLNDAMPGQSTKLEREYFGVGGPNELSYVDKFNQYGLFSTGSKDKSDLLGLGKSESTVSDKLKMFGFTDNTENIDVENKLNMFGLKKSTNNIFGQNKGDNKMTNKTNDYMPKFEGLNMGQKLSDYGFNNGKKSNNVFSKTLSEYGFNNKSNINLNTTQKLQQFGLNTVKPLQFNQKSKKAENNFNVQNKLKQFGMYQGKQKSPINTFDVNAKINQLVGPKKAITNERNALKHIIKQPEKQSWNRLNKQKGLSMWGDYDGDKLANILDCDPLNPNKQAFWHDLFSKGKQLLTRNKEDNNTVVYQSETQVNAKDVPQQNIIERAEDLAMQSNVENEEMQAEDQAKALNVWERYQAKRQAATELKQAQQEGEYERQLAIAKMTPEEKQAYELQQAALEKEKLAIKKPSIIEKVLPKKEVTDQGPGSTIDISQYKLDTSGRPIKIGDQYILKSKADIRKETAQAKQEEQKARKEELSVAKLMKELKVVPGTQQQYRGWGQYPVAQSIAAGVSAGVLPTGLYGQTAQTEQLLGTQTDAGYSAQKLAFLASAPSAAPGAFSTKVAELVGTVGDKKTPIEAIRDIAEVSKVLPQPPVIQPPVPQPTPQPVVQPVQYTTTQPATTRSTATKSPYTPRPVTYVRGPYRKTRMRKLEQNSDEE